MRDWGPQASSFWEVGGGNSLELPLAAGQSAQQPDPFPFVTEIPTSDMLAGVTYPFMIPKIEQHMHQEHEHPNLI